MRKTKWGYKVGVEGHPHELYFDPSPCLCGSIKDGVCLEFRNPDPPSRRSGLEGGWVISYKELLEMADLSTKARAGHNKEDTNG